MLLRRRARLNAGHPEISGSMAGERRPRQSSRMPDDTRSRRGYRSATRPPPRGAPAPAATPTRSCGDAFTTLDGRRLYLRAIGPEDANALRRGFARLTPEQVRLRTFHRIAELSPEIVDRLTRIDPETASAYVAVDAGGEIRGDARLSVDRATETAEFGVVVDPGYTGQGVGSRLMQKIVEDAERRGVREIWGDVLAENHAMLDFAKAIGAERRALADEPGVLRVTFRVLDDVRKRR
jgi:acetyltransferase